MGGRYYSYVIGICSALIITGLSNAYGNTVSEQVQQNIDTLMQTNGCPGCNLQGADLNRMDLSGADLSQADLSGASFFLTDLDGANLSGANLRDAKFGGADLADADLRNADLRGALLDGAYLEGSLMDDSMVEKKMVHEEVEVDSTEKVYVPDQTKPKEVMDHKKVAFEADQPQTEEPAEQTLQEAPPVKNVTPIQQISIDEENQKKNDKAVNETAESSEIEKYAQQETDGSPSDREEVDREADKSAVPDQKNPPPPAEEKRQAEAEKMMEPAAAAAVTTVLSADTSELIEKLLDDKRCYGCDLQGVDFHGKNLRRFDLERSDLSGANLEDVDFEQANLKGVSFKGANLRNADLRKADLYKADLSGADLTGADLREAQLDEAVFTGTIGYQTSVITQ